MERNFDAEWEAREEDFMQDQIDTKAILTSFFYDLIKTIPAGTINRAICNTIIYKVDPRSPNIQYCDKQLQAYAESCAEQLLTYHTKYTFQELRAMGFADSVAKKEDVVD